ncbi:thrombospondin type-1 domain-containing protein 1-like, partial [Ruditapes philippinarum]|uniref:thrombospondin type-1 domain-containing protein 1-like n=1 Tax=Ruditapes philippinarum TaxID=129788 RepID=UPI00295A805E
MTIPENGRVLGNIMKVGAKIRYICENGYKLKDNRYTSVAECLNTGHWSANAECVLVTYTGTIWSDWSSCNVSCGGGIRTRNRSCTVPTLNSNDVQCSQDDPDFESETCNNQTCH